MKQSAKRSSANEILLLFHTALTLFLFSTMEPSEDTALVSRRRQLRVSSVDVTDPLSRTSSRSMPHVGSIEEEPTGEPEKKPEESEKKPEEVEKKSTSITELMQLTCYLDNTGSVARDHVRIHQEKHAITCDKMLKIT